jgi:hypothetical protein
MECGLLQDYRLLTQSVLWLACHPALGAKILSLLRISPSLFSHFIGVAGGIRRCVNDVDAMPSREVESIAAVLSESGKGDARSWQRWGATSW